MSPRPENDRVLLLGSAQGRRLGGLRAGREVRELTFAGSEVGPAARRSPAGAAASPRRRQPPWRMGARGDGANDDHDDAGVGAPLDIDDDQAAEEGVGEMVDLQGLLEAVLQHRARELVSSSLDGAQPHYMAGSVGASWARDTSRRGGSAPCPGFRVCTRQPRLASRTRRGIAGSVHRPSLDKALQTQFDPPPIASANQSPDCAALLVALRKRKGNSRSS
jgi:hypothetical protein